MEMVKAWNGKWHLFEDDLPPQPAVPDSGWASYPVCLQKDGQVTIDGKWAHFHRRTRCDKCQNHGVRWRRLPLPQPERQRALTACGQEVMVRARNTVAPKIATGWLASTPKACSFCKPVFLRRMA